MECLVTFLILLVTFLFVTGSVARSQSERARRRRVYQQLAARFAGSYVPGGLWRQPGVRIRYGETRAVVCESSARGPYREPCTQITIDWPDPSLRCELLPRRLAHADGRVRGWIKVHVGDPAFDRRFVARGRSRTDLRDFLRGGVRWQIERLARLFSDDSVYILVRRGSMLIQKPRLIRRAEELQEFVERSLEFYDQAMLTRADGIEFLAENEAQPLGQVICRVCGEDIAGDMVFCRRCKTPHHTDCWHFAGICSVYGCGEKSYLVPQPAQATRRPHGTFDSAHRG